MTIRSGVSPRECWKVVLIDDLRDIMMMYLCTKQNNVIPLLNVKLTSFEHLSAKCHSVGLRKLSQYADSSLVRYPSMDH